MWNSIFCEGVKIFSFKTFRFDYKISPPKDFMEASVPPYIVIPTAMKKTVLLYARLKTNDPTLTGESEEEEKVKTDKKT